MFVAPIVSAALLTMATLEIIFFIDVITAVIAIITLLGFLKISVHQKAANQQPLSYLNDFKQGLTYIKNSHFLKQLFLFFGVFFILLAPAAFLTPLQVTRSFGSDVWRLTAIEIAFSVGMMAGGGIIASWGGFKNKIHTMTLASIIMGLCTFALGVMPIFWIYLIFMAVFGMISTSMMPIGMLIFGPMADVFRVEWLLVGTGILILFLSLFLGGNKVLLEAGKPEVEER